NTNGPSLPVQFLPQGPGGYPALLPDRTSVPSLRTSATPKSKQGKIWSSPRQSCSTKYSTTFSWLIGDSDDFNFDNVWYTKSRESFRPLFCSANCIAASMASVTCSANSCRVMISVLEF